MEQKRNVFKYVESHWLSLYAKTLKKQLKLTFTTYEGSFLHGLLLINVNYALRNYAILRKSFANR